MTIGASTLRERARKYAELLLKDIAAEPDLPTAIVAGEWLAHYLSSNLCGIYRLDALEEDIVGRLQDITPVHSQATSLRPELHVASQLYPHGGHSQLLKTLVGHASSAPDILLTRDGEQGEAARILDIDARRIFQAQGAQVLDRILDMASTMAAYERIVLHIHPEDLPCALALRLARKANPGLRVGLFNHADHSFSVAIGAADVVFEISTYGWSLREARGTVNASTFVGIPIAARGHRQPPPDTQEVYALSAGAAYKYKPTSEPRLPDLLGELLDKTRDLGLKLIGPSPEDAWWQPLRKTHGDRLTILAHLPRAEYMAQLTGCSLYIDSHPLTGGTAFPEALLSGLNVVGLKGGTWGFSYADLLRASDRDSFLLNCREILERQPDILAHQETIRQQCLAFHAPSAVLLRMNAALANPDALQSPPQAMLALGLPPLMGETNWEKAGRSVYLLPTRYQSSFSIHQTIAMRHFQAFGLTDRASWRLFIKSKVRRLQAKVRGRSKRR